MVKQTTYSPTNENRSQLPDLKWVDKIADVMDSRFRIPGTNFRFGLDPILGLLPGIGDATSLAVSGVLIFYMAKYGASRKLIILMTGNALLDAVVGSIPIVGNILDFFNKANVRNIKLMRAHYYEGKHQGSGKGTLAAILLVIVVFIGLIIYGTWALISYLVDALAAAPV